MLDLNFGTTTGRVRDMVRVRDEEAILLLSRSDIVSYAECKSIRSRVAQSHLASIQLFSAEK
jgi:hypothetical protein